MMPLWERQALEQFEMQMEPRYLSKRSHFDLLRAWFQVLHHCAKNQNKELALQFTGADSSSSFLNAVNCLGVTALMTAAKYGRYVEA